MGHEVIFTEEITERITKSKIQQSTGQGCLHPHGIEWKTVLLSGLISFIVVVIGLYIEYHIFIR